MGRQAENFATEPHHCLIAEAIVAAKQVRPAVPAKTCAVAQVLKTDGQFGIVNWHQMPREQTTVLDKPRGPKTEMRMSPQQVRAVIEPAGFALINLVELPPYHYGIVFRKAADKVPCNPGGVEP